MHCIVNYYILCKTTLIECYLNITGEVEEEEGRGRSHVARIHRAMEETKSKGRRRVEKTERSTGKKKRG